MIIIFRLIMFIARLPLFIFLFFRGTRRTLNELSHSHAAVCLICLIAVASLFLKPPQAEGSFLESMAIDTKAISLANNVTANPPGILSIYYNPAGLSLMGDGNYITMGAIPVILSRKTTFQKDPNFQEFHDFNGNTITDPAAGKETSNTSGRMYIPLLDTTLDSLMGPIFGVSHRNPGSNWTFGYSAYAAFAGGWNSGDTDDPSRYEGKSVYIQHLVYAGPGVSYRVSDTFSLGASFGLGQTAMGVSMDVRAPNEIVNITKVLGDATAHMSTSLLDVIIPMPLFGGGMGPYDNVGNLTFNIRDDFSPSYNLGALWQPFDWVSFGLDYQSAIKSHLSGKYSLKYSDKWQNMVAWDGSTAVMQIVSMIFDLPYQTTSEQSGTVTTDIEFPQIVNFGIKLKPLKRLSIETDLHWANWSSIKEDNFVFDQQIQLLQFSKFMGYTGGSYNLKMTRNFKDTLTWGVGMEYQALDWLALRAGYENRTASTVDEYYDLLYSVPTLDYYGCGLGIKWNKIDIDLALGYLVNKKYTIGSSASINANSNQLGAGVNNPYRGLIIEQEMNIYMGSIKATMPLDVVTGVLYGSIDKLKPSKWFGKAPAKGSLTTAGTTKTVDSSATIINNLRPEDKNYYIEDSE